MDKNILIAVTAESLVVGVGMASIYSLAKDYIALKTLGWYRRATMPLIVMESVSILAILYVNYIVFVR